MEEKQPIDYIMICDLDNCFIDSRDWYKAGVPGEGDRAGWDAFQEKITLCKPNRPVIDLVCATADLLPVMFVTGREDRKDHRKRTIDQVYEFSNGIFDLGNKKSPHKLLMRGEFDYRASDVVKEEILHKLIEAGHMPLVAIDDEIQNCEMFKKYNIPTIKYDIETNVFHRYFKPTLEGVAYDSGSDI